MRIGDWNIASANARQHRVDYGFLETSSSSDWMAGANIPFFMTGGVKPKKIPVTIVVHGKDKREVKNNISMILAKCIGVKEFYLDKDDHIYYGVVSRATPEQKTDRWTNLKLELSCVEYGYLNKKTFTGTSNTFVNDGNIKTPVKIIIKPKTSGEVTINFSGQTAKINNGIVNTEYVFDGIKGLFTKNGVNAFSEFTFDGLPYIDPGNVKVTLSRSSEVTFIYNPYFM